MSKLKKRVSVGPDLNSIQANILPLVPHVIQDYYRLRRQIMAKKTGNLPNIDQLWGNEVQNSNNLISAAQEADKSQVIIEVFNKDEKKPSEILESVPKGKGSAANKGNDKFDWVNHLKLIKKQTITQSNDLKSLNDSKNQRPNKYKSPYIANYKNQRAKAFLLKKQREQEQNLKKVVERLAMPKSYPTSLREPWALTDKIRTFQPSQRLIEIAQPKFKFTNSLTLSEVLKVKESALNYTATDRIRQLALPLQCTNLSIREDPYEISPNALNAQLTPRVAELASPKKRIDRYQRKCPFKVKKRALRGKIPKHVQEISSPKRTPSQSASN